jgi:DNA-directed RNA polymerase II subunit RPB7
MFFLKEETKVISLHPSFFGPNMREYLITRLNEEEEGRCTGDHFVICVMDMVDIGEGRVIPSSGNAEYTIKYRAIIWKPFRGETVRWKKKKYKLHETSAELFLLGLV